MNTSIHGFRKVREEEVSEMNSTARIFEHIKTGARLIHLDNDDDNKTFVISFKTPPEDDTGLPHIMEHSVLVGSRKFPSKSPMLELVKGSLNTFINAFTSSDKTFYPVASRNEQDFHNLMHVYLDAVFYPRLHEMEEVLLQEGWHYELKDKDAELIYNGVVYNEMKGAFSTPDGLFNRKIINSLFPDTAYRFESGGDPDFIPDLTYEQFKAFHRKHYHPSNSYIFLYGDLDLDRHLEFIDGEYLSNFERADLDINIPVQKPFNAPVTGVGEYSVSNDSQDDDAAFLGLSFVIGRSTDPVLCLGLSILKRILLDTQASPLKKALLDAEIGKDIRGNLNDSILQPVFSFIAKRATVDDQERFRELVLQNLRNLAENGIDPRLVEASINSTEFTLREAEFPGRPKGLIYNISVLDSWMYDGDPLAHLKFEEPLAKIKAEAKNGYFEKLIKEHFLNNNHSCLQVLKPVKGLTEKNSEALREKLSDYKNSLSAEEIETIVLKTQELKKLQSTPDKPEDLETIPNLQLKDVNPASEILPVKEMKLNGVKALSHDIFTGGIGYFSLYFDMKAVPQDLIQYAELLARLLGKVGTSKYDYGELSNEINTHTGGIGFTVNALSGKDDVREYFPKFMVTSKSLISKLPQLNDLIGEILFDSVLNDKKRIRETIQAVKSQMQSNISFYGDYYAQMKALSSISPTGCYDDMISGISFYQFINDLESNFDEKFDGIVHNLERLPGYLFNAENMLCSFTSPESDFSILENASKGLIERIPKDKLERQEINFELTGKSIGLTTPGKIVYVVSVNNFRDFGSEISGSLKVASKVIQLGYLWNRIRIQGGAYGTHIALNRNGEIAFSSYRDPNLTATLETYRGAGEFIKGVELSERELTKYILGSIRDLDYPLTPSMKGSRATYQHIIGLTQDEIQKLRDEILSTTLKDLQATSDLITEAAKGGCIAVLGNETMIDANKDLFGEIEKVL